MTESINSGKECPHKGVSLHRIGGHRAKGQIHPVETAPGRVGSGCRRGHNGRKGAMASARNRSKWLSVDKNEWVGGL